MARASSGATRSWDGGGGAASASAPAKTMLRIMEASCLLRGRGLHGPRPSADHKPRAARRGGARPVSVPFRGRQRDVAALDGDLAELPALFERDAARDL